MTFCGPEDALAELVAALESAGEHPTRVSEAALSPDALPDIVATTLLVSTLNKLVEVAVDGVRAKWRERVQIRLVPIQVRLRCGEPDCDFATDDASIYIEAKWADKGLPKCPHGHELVEVERGIFPNLIDDE